jgi:hypothetical protein
MHKNATKCNETIGKWCKNKHGASKIIDTFETYQGVGSHTALKSSSFFSACWQVSKDEVIGEWLCPRWYFSNVENAFNQWICVPRVC